MPYGYMRMFQRAALALLLALGGVFAVATPAHAACGDTTAEWVNPLTGSTWTGTFGTTSFTLVLSPVGSVAATVVVPNSGLGTWVHDYDTRWTSSLAGIWEYHFEVTPTSCAGGKVTAAQGGMMDGLYVIYGVSMTRVT